MNLTQPFSLSYKISVKWILAIIFCYFRFYLPYQIYLSVIAATEGQAVYKAHLFFILGCVCHAGVTSLLWKEMRVRTISISHREDVRWILWEHSPRGYLPSAMAFLLIWYTHMRARMHTHEWRLFTGITVIQAWLQASQDSKQIKKTNGACRLIAVS